MRASICWALPLLALFGSEVLGNVSWRPTTPHQSFESTKMYRVNSFWKVYQNTWYNNGKWFSITDDEHGDDYIESGISVNAHIVEMPVENVDKYMKAMDTQWTPGVTLLVDFPFPAYPDNIGHWAEVMVPIYSMILGRHDADGYLMAVQGKTTPGIDAILLTNLDSSKMSEWFVNVLDIAIEPIVAANGGRRPALIYSNDFWRLPMAKWTGFENLVVPTDRYTHPDRLTGFPSPDHGDAWRHDGCERFVSNFKVGFAKPEHAISFRNAAYEMAEWPLPEPWEQGTPASVPKVITWMSNVGNAETVENTEEFRDMLRSVAAERGWRMQEKQISTQTAFVSYIAAMAGTGVLVSRHSPLLANALFLPPGAAVVELMGYNWEWRQISQLYFNITQSIEDVHHVGWRARDPKWAVYREPSHARYATWTPEECSSRECLVVHAQAGLIADVEAVRERVSGAIDAIEKGTPVADIRQPWPVA